MAGFLSGLRRQRSDRYNLWRLVDARFVKGAGEAAARQQLICDIDKTYLETEFESLVKIARIAFFEEASDKVTVEGASEVLLAARWGQMGDTLDRSQYPRPLHFVSSSPPQLRRVLEEKLTMDGLDWTSDTFKNQVYNIRKGRFDLLRQQIAYKSAAILHIMGACEQSTDFYLIGDNAESDALIYLGIKLFVEGKLTAEAYLAYLEIAGIERPVAADLIGRYARRPPARVKAILIRNLPSYRFSGKAPLTAPIMLFDNYLEAALVLILTGMMEAACLWPLVRLFHNRYAVAARELCGCLAAFSSWVTADAPEIAAAFALAQKRLAPLLGGSKEAPGYRSLRKPDDGPLASMSEQSILALSRDWVESLGRIRRERS